MPNNPDSWNPQLTEGRALVLAAEGELQAALHMLEMGDRADKRMVSERVKAAFDALKQARERLDTLARL